MDRIRNRRPSCSSTHASQRADGFHGQHDRRARTSRIVVRWVVVSRSHLPSRCLGGSPPGSQSSRLAARTVTERADCGWARVVRVRGQSFVSFASRHGSLPRPRSIVRSFLGLFVRLISSFSSHVFVLGDGRWVLRFRSLTLVCPPLFPVLLWIPVHPLTCWLIVARAAAISFDPSACSRVVLARVA